MNKTTLIPTIKEIRKSKYKYVYVGKVVEANSSSVNSYISNIERVNKADAKDDAFQILVDIDNGVTNSEDWR